MKLGNKKKLYLQKMSYRINYAKLKVTPQRGWWRDHFTKDDAVFTDHFRKDDV